MNRTELAMRHIELLFRTSKKRRAPHVGNICPNFKIELHNLKKRNIFFRHYLF